MHTSNVNSLILISLNSNNANVGDNLQPCSRQQFANLAPARKYMITQVAKYDNDNDNENPDSLNQAVRLTKPNYLFTKCYVA